MTEEHINKNDDINSSLLTEYRECRASIKKMVIDLEALTEKLILIFPDKIDNRFKYLFEEKVRTMTDLYKTILDMKKEIIKSVKDEIEIRRKIVMPTDEINDDDIDIRSIVNKVERMFSKKEKIIEKIDNIDSEKIDNIN